MRRALALVALVCAACSNEPSFREDDLREEILRQHPTFDEANVDNMVELVRTECEIGGAHRYADGELLALLEAACPVDD